MNILQVTYDYFPNPLWGVGPHVKSLAQSLYQSGHKVVIIARNRLGFGKVKEKLDFASVYRPAHIDQYEQKGYLETIQILNEDLRRVVLSRLDYFQPDIIHNHTWMTFPIAWEYSRNLNIPLISTVHFVESIQKDNQHPRKNLLKRIQMEEKRMVTHSDYLIFPSHAMKQKVLEDHPYLKYGKVIYHGVDISSKKPKGKEMLKPIILFIGRFEPEKIRFPL